MEAKFKTQEKETYISPDIVVVDIETEQNILQSSSELPGMLGDDW